MPMIASGGAPRAQGLRLDRIGTGRTADPDRASPRRALRRWMQCWASTVPCAAFLCCGVVSAGQQFVAAGPGFAASTLDEAVPAAAGDALPDSMLPDEPTPQTPLSQPALADAALQEAAKPAAGNRTLGSVHGVVSGADGSVYQGAHVELSVAGSQSTALEATSDGEGRFSFLNLPEGEFKISVSLSGFSTAVESGVLHAGESLEVKPIVLEMKSAASEVVVTATRVEIAQAQLKEEETQRVFGVIPNFYVAYAPDAAPLTARQKYGLAWKSVIDPVTLLSVGIVAGVEQATNSYSGYGQGTQGYAKRFGAGFADNLTGTFIGGAILASWWKEDPRYFYQGTGTKRSRAWHAIASAVMCKSDRGHWEVNYAGIVGGLASAGISNAYYPPADREGAELTFQNALIGTGEGAIQNLLQEFVVRKLTPHVPHYGSGNP